VDNRADHIMYAIENYDISKYKVCQFRLDEKVRKMAEIIIEKPAMQKVIYKLEKPSEELAFAYYILFISSHAYSMRQKNVLNDEEWTGWLHWMKNCFKYGTIGEQWKQIQSERWLNPAFENFVNREIMEARSQQSPA
jgi:hypothetical protein